MQIKFPLQNIKEFLTYSKDITTEKSDLLPVLRYIRIEIDFGICTMIKSNMASFIKYTFDTTESDCQIIIPEKEFEDFCASCSESTSFILLTMGDKNINTLKDGFGYVKKYNDGGYKFEQFPDAGVNEDIFEFYRFDKTIIDSIKLAVCYAGLDELLPKYSSIYINETHIYSCAIQIAYVSEHNSKLPVAALSRKECGVIQKFDYCDFATNSDLNFNLYRVGSVIYGFRKADGADGINYQMFLSNFKKEKYFVVPVSVLNRFCTSVRNYSNRNDDKSRNNAKWKNSSLLVSGGEVYLNFDMTKEVGENIEFKSPVTTYGCDNFDFLFNHGQCSEIFKTLPYEEICISDLGKIFALFNQKDLNYVGFISKQQPNL